MRIKVITNYYERPIYLSLISLFMIINIIYYSDRMKHV